MELADAARVEHARLTQVARVHADEARARMDRSPERGRFVGLDERLHAETPRELDEAVERHVVERFGDEEDEVGAERARLEELQLVDDDVLREQRDLHRRAHRSEVVQAAAPVPRLREDRDRGGTRGRVRERLPRGIDARVQHARGG